MSDRDPFIQLRNAGEIRTPVEDVMARGRALRRRRKVRQLSAVGLVVVAAAGIAGGVVVGLGSHQRPTVAAASPSPTTTTTAAPAPIVQATAPRGPLICASAYPGGPVPEGSAPRITGGLPSGLTLSSSTTRTALTCAVPQLALLFSSSNAQNKGAVALWGPGAISDTRSISDTAAPASVHGRAAVLKTTGTGLELSWTESNGASWVLSDTALAAADITRLANDLVIGSNNVAELPTVASYSLEVDAPQIFVPQNTTTVATLAHYSGSSGGLDVTIEDNGVRAVGPLIAALTRPEVLSYVTVRGHQGVVSSGGSGASLTWAETPTRTVVLSGVDGVSQLVAIANGLEFGP